MAALFWLGILIALGAAVVFAALGVLPLYAAIRTTREQIIPGFRPDRPGPLERALALAAVWLPAIVTGLFGLYACAQLLLLALRSRG
ncbi:MAG TPA: hypothetical protein VNL77_15635 [Roseiflexaceae bacterium]|nr:hypothetical protein [Roseiflexaceae bacterium]